MRFLHFVRRTLLTSVAATTLVSAAGAVPALAISASPEKAPLFNGSVYAIAYRGSTVYVADSGFSPYGDRSPDYVVGRAIAVTRFLEARDIDVLVGAGRRLTRYLARHLASWQVAVDLAHRHATRRMG